jgi:hypothetical protein
MRNLNHQPPGTEPKWYSLEFMMDLSEWYHVAATVSRSTSPRTITFYVNGTSVGTVADPDIPTGKLVGTDWVYDKGFPKMDIGHSYPSADFNHNPYTYEYFFEGYLDEVEIFNRALEPIEIQKIYLADSYGKCRDHCRVPSVTPFCIDETEKTINVTIWNESEDDLNNRLHLHLGGTQATGNCNFDFSQPPTDYTHFNPNCYTIPFIGKHSYVNVEVKITRPAGFSPGDVACYEVSLQDLVTGETFVCNGTIKGTWDWCPAPIPEPVPITLYDLLVVPFVVRNTGDSTELFNYSISVRAGCCGDSSSSIVSLNGLPPGTDVIGSLSVPLNESATLTVQAALTRFEPFDPQEVVLLSDHDGDGVMEPLAATALYPITFPDCNNNAIDDSVDIATGTSLDRNDNSFPDECDSYGDTTSMPSCGPMIKIEKIHNSLQGHYEFVSITTENSTLPMGGFDFLIAYDASALTLHEVLPGAEISAPTLWEYFTYRFGATGNCNGPCPSGLVRIVAIADINNGFPHPPADAYNVNGLVAILKFLVTNDRTYNCQFVPVGFYWLDCTDNVLSSPDGQTAYLNRDVWWYLGEQGSDTYIRIDTVTDGTVWGGYGGWKGILGDPDCLAGDKVDPLPWVDFWDGGIDIACADSIDARGDLNLNGIANEIADAVIYTQYFLIGIDAFPVYGRQGAIAASDVNGDGTPLSVGDLVYLIRIISGDALPYAKLSPFAQDMNVHFDGKVVATESNVNIGAVLLTFKVGDDFKVTNLTNLTLVQSLTAGELKVLLYDISTKSIGSGLREVVRIEGQAELVTAEVADYNGNMLTSKLEQATLPTTFALGQNYPNPFNPETVIEFALPTTGEVSLKIYNVAGQLVRTLVSGTTPAGYHQIRWDGRDANGSDISSGVYFYKIDTKNFSETRKMLLVK